MSFVQGQSLCSGSFLRPTLMGVRERSPLQFRCFCPVGPSYCNHAHAITLLKTNILFPSVENGSPFLREGLSSDTGIQSLHVSLNHWGGPYSCPHHQVSAWLGINLLVLRTYVHFLERLLNFFPNLWVKISAIFFRLYFDNVFINPFSSLLTSFFRKTYHTAVLGKQPTSWPPELPVVGWTCDQGQPIIS